MQEQYCKLLDVSRNTYYVHKREDRKILSLLEKYFTESDLEEFLQTGKIEKLEDSKTNDTSWEEFIFKNAIFKITHAQNYPFYLIAHILGIKYVQDYATFLIALDGYEPKSQKLETEKRFLSYFFCFVD